MLAANAILIRGDLREKYGLDRTGDQKRIWKNIIRRCQMTRILRLLMPMMLHRTMILPRQSCFRPKMIGEGWKAPWSIMCPINIPMDFSADDLFWMYGTEEYLEYAKLMKKWADSGFWSKSAIANSTDVKEAFLNGTSASYTQNLGSVGAVASEIEESHPEWKPEVYDLFPSAHRFYAAYTGDGVAVLANSQNQARAFMALDLMKFDPDLYYLIRHGIKGVHYDVTDDGMWKPGPDMSKNNYGNGFSWGFKNSMYDMTREGTFKDQYEIGEVWKAKAIEGPTTAFSFDDSNVKNELANLQSVYTQYAPLLDLGLVDDVEKTLADFNKQAEAAGLQKILDEAKAQVAAFLENSK